MAGRERREEGFPRMGLKMEKGRSSSSNRNDWYATFKRDFLAGGVMAGVAHTIVAPIERTKVLLQTQESNIAILGGGHRRFKGMFDCIFRTVKEEGILSLWRGKGISVLRHYPSLALNFSLKDGAFRIEPFPQVFHVRIELHVLVVCEMLGCNEARSYSCLPPRLTPDFVAVEEQKEAGSWRVCGGFDKHQQDS